MQRAKQMIGSLWVERTVAYMLLGLTAGVMLAVVHPSLHDRGFLAAWDAGGHLLKAQYFADHLLPHGLLSGWFPVWHGGFDLFQFYPPLLYYLLGPLTLVFPDELALRVMMAGLWIGLVPVTYYLLRSFHLSRVLAALGAMMLLALNASFGIGLGALYGVGLLPNGLGFIMAIWALGRLQRDLDDPGRPLWKVLVTGLVFGLLILSHTFSTYWWGLASLTLLTAYAWGKPTAGILVKRYAMIIAVGMLVSAYWWVPLLLGLDEMGQTGNIQQATRGQIFEGLVLAKDYGGWVISLLGIGGLVYLGATRRYRMLAFFGILLGLTLLLSLNLINAVLPFSSVVGSSQFIRFHAFFAYLVMLLAVFGLAGAYVGLRKASGLELFPRLLFGFGTLLLFLLVVLPTLDHKRGFVRTVDTRPANDIHAVAAYLDQHLRPGEFILTEFNWDARLYYGSPHFANQRLPLYSERVWDLNGNFPEGTHGSELPVLISNQFGSPPELFTQFDYLRTRGVRYLVTTTPASFAALAVYPQVQPVWHGHALGIMELRDPGPPLGVPGGVVPVVDFTPNVYRLTFDQPATLPAGTNLAVSAHPWLEVWGDGAEIRTIDGEDRLTLADDVTAQQMEIRYRPPPPVQIAGAVSILSVLGVLAYLLRPRWPERVKRVARRRPRVRRRARR